MDAETVSVRTHLKKKIRVYGKALGREKAAHTRFFCLLNSLARKPGSLGQDFLL
jgi:hypothetical protein